jgi:hypothetical protein
MKNGFRGDPSLAVYYRMIPISQIAISCSALPLLWILARTTAATIILALFMSLHRVELRTSSSSYVVAVGGVETSSLAVLHSHAVGRY